MSEARHSGVAPGAVLLPDEPIDPVRVTALRLWAPPSEPLARIFPRVRELTGLQRLMVGPVAGRAAVAGISAESVPPSVTTLGVFTGGSATTWPPGVMLPLVTGLRADGPLMLTRDALPNVRAVVIKPARNSQNLDEIVAVPSLRELHLITVPAGVFERIGHLPLTGLGLLGGGLTTLDGIEALDGLTSLRLHNLRSLRFLAALAGSGVETLQIRYCDAVTDFGTLAELPRLRHLQLVGCGTPDLSEVSDGVQVTVH